MADFFLSQHKIMTSLCVFGVFTLPRSFKIVSIVGADPFMMEHKTFISVLLLKIQIKNMHKINTKPLRLMLILGGIVCAQQAYSFCLPGFHECSGLKKDGTPATWCAADGAKCGNWIIPNNPELAPWCRPLWPYSNCK